MLNQNELPDFDPAWDYATIYERLNNASNSLINVLNNLADAEDATPEMDAWLTAMIQSIGEDLNSINGLMKQD